MMPNLDAPRGDYCADCGGFDIERMYTCPKHKRVQYCRGCECPCCVDEALENGEYDWDALDAPRGKE